MENENYSISVVHQLKIDGKTFKEEKEYTKFEFKIDESNKLGEGSESVHTRSIKYKENCNYYRVVQAEYNNEKLETETETNMDEDQVESFQKEWSTNWNPNLGQPPNNKLLYGILRILNTIYDSFLQIP